MFKPPIRGRVPLKKKPEPSFSLEEFAGSVGNVGALAQELKELKDEVIEVVDYKIEEVENTLQDHIKTIVDTTKVLEDTKSEAIALINEIKVGPKGIDADEKRVADMVRSQFPDAKKLEKDILAKVPKFDEKKLKRDILENIPKASLKVIQSKLEVDPLSVVEKIMALPKGKFKFTMDNVEGLKQTMSAFQSQLGRGYLHGGGDTVAAGTNITITTNAAGQKVINATSGTTLELETNGTPNGSQALLNLVQGSNVTITDDGLGNVTIAATGDTGVSGVTGTSPIIVDNTDPANPIVTIQQANTSQSGFLSDTDWDTFNNKQPAGTYVTAVSVASANGFSGSSSGGATPQLTLTTSITGVLKGNGTAISAATSGTDYSAGTSALATGILKSTTATGALTIAVAGDFPTLNQNTTGSAATLTTSRTIGIATGDVTSAGSSFDGSANNTNAYTLATVNANVGSFGSSTSIPSFTVNAKGLITAASGNAVIAPAGTLTGTTLNATVVTSSLTSVGTIGTGVWQGTAIGDSYITNTLTGKSVNGVTLTTAGSSTKYLSEDGTYSTPAGGGSGITIGTTTITSGTNTRILYNNSGVVGEYTLTGSGTVVAMQTAPTFATSITGSYLTASEILITDGSKNIVSAPVATYPSLTELTYLKGVTSAIQTQINAKGAGTVTSVGFTGGLISVATATTTPALTVAGTSGGIPYFSSASTWATSAALASNALVIGGGAGAAPATTTTGTGVLTALAINVGSAGAFLPNNGAGTSLTGIPYSLTGTANQITLSAATGNITFSLPNDLRITSASVGTNADSIPTLSSTSTLTNKTLTSPTITTASLSGTQLLAEGAAIGLDPSLSADGTWSGITMTATAGYTQAFGDLVYLDPTDSRWEACDANAAAGADGDSRGIIGMVVVAGTDGNACTILLQGTVRADANFPSFTVNNPIYVSETAGDVTQTQPVTTDVVIRVVGFALTADSMFFNPDGAYITHT